VLLIVAIVLLLLFAGLGAFVAHILWLGLIVALIVFVAHALTGRKV
jgi:hypothetical protein